MAKGMFALVELDDVVADSSHRASVDIEKDRIDMMAGDELIYPTSRMLKGFYRSGIEIVLVTTKRLLKEEREVTRAWLSAHGVTYDYLVQAASVEHLTRWIKDNQRENILVMAICAGSKLISMANSHPHKPHIYQVQR
ncbi:TPA: hypothetical protein N2N45_004287 [Klebsiella aerogenes]|nr:hypothetical protein [Klebsiella aerogenes]